MADEEPEQERVGYKRPPRHTRFKEGRSGNPRGRPRGAVGKAPAIVARIFAQKLRVNTQSGEQRMSTIRISLEQMVNDAIRGDLGAIELVLKLCQRIGAFDPALPPEQLSGVYVATKEEFEAYWAWRLNRPRAPEEQL